MTSLDPTHLPNVGWKPQPKTRGEAVHEISRPTSALPIRALPDLRFEQSYLLALKPFVHIHPKQTGVPKARGTVEDPIVEDTALAEPLLTDIAVESAGVSRYGVPDSIEWGNVVWVTTRDQVISPLLQGALWGTASLFLAPLSKKLSLSLRELFVGPAQQRSASYEPTRVIRGQDSMGWLRPWVHSLGGGIETNAAL